MWRHGSDPYDHGTWPGNVGIAVDRYSGRAEVTYDNREGGIARVWEDWQYPFHAGYFMGWGYRMIAGSCFGFLPLVLAVTGVHHVVDAPPQAQAQAAAARHRVSESLNTAVVVYAAGLGAWALVTAFSGAALARGQLAALVALELGLLLQAALALGGLALGSEPREPATSLGYLAASVLILPAVMPAARSRSRWDTGVIALVCLALAVVCMRLRTTWGRG